MFGVKGKNKLSLLVWGLELLDWTSSMWKHFRHHVHFWCPWDSLRWVRCWEGAFICQMPTSPEHNEVMVTLFSLSWKTGYCWWSHLEGLGQVERLANEVYITVKAGKPVPLLINNTKYLKGRITPHICQTYLQNKIWGGYTAVWGITRGWLCSQIGFVLGILTRPLENDQRWNREKIERAELGSNDFSGNPKRLKLGINYCTWGLYTTLE